MKGKIVIGLNKTAADFIPAKSRFLLIDHGPIAKVFLKKFPHARLFDSKEHHINPLPMEHAEAREFASLVFADAGPTTLRTRDGKRALTRMLKSHAQLDEIKAGRRDPDDEKEAAAAVADVLESPVLKKVFTGQPINFSFKYQAIVARIDPAELGEDEARLLAATLICRFKGQIIIPDFGFYARPFHAQLIRQKRLTAGVNTLSELDQKIRDQCLLMEKVARGCMNDDAVKLAEYLKLRPDPTRKNNPYNEFIDAAMA